MTVYDQIKRNNFKTILLVVAFPLIFIALIFLFVWMVAPIETAVQTTIRVAIPTFIACFVWMLISWLFGDSMMLSSANAVQINSSEKQYRAIFQSVENVSLAAGLPTPRVYIINDDSIMNAFATGRSPNDASIALTTGLIKNLDSAEVQGVIAHEMAHVGNRDIRLDMMIITGVGVTVFAADILLRMALHSGDSRDEKNNSAAILLMVYAAFMVFNFIITPLLRLAVSRNREFAADATAAHITRNPLALASALRKISGDTKPSKWDLLLTHPNTDKRIARLEQMAGK